MILIEDLDEPESVLYPLRELQSKKKITKTVVHKDKKGTTKETLKWVHITISNAKRNLLGNYHKIKGKYLQLYLNEFVYKLNRRYFEEKLFDRLVIANITGL